jgi:hypothetical protein
VWIILFLILIGLGALGYVYRERVKHWYYKARELIRQKLGKGRGGPAPAPAMTRPRPPYPPMYPPARPLTHPRTAISSDIEETLKKLRDIGK